MYGEITSKYSKYLSDYGSFFLLLLFFGSQCTYHCYRLTAVDILRLDEQVRGKQQACVSGNETHLFSTFMVFRNWCVVLCGVAETERLLSKQVRGCSCHLAASKPYEL